MYATAFTPLRKWCRRGALLGACMLAGMSGALQAAEPPVTRTLQAIVSAPDTPLASLSALVIRGGQVVYEGQFGLRQMPQTEGAPGLPADHETLYRVASVSKLVTTIGLMRLVEAGQLDLDADLSQYLGYALRNPHFAQAPITARMLLTHTSSLRDGGGYFMPLGTSLQTALQGGNPAAWASPQADADRAPGRYFAYCNLNFVVLGTLIERITAKRFDVYMQEAVLRPLGIAGGFTPETLSQADISHLAVLYRKGQDGKFQPKGPWVAQTDNFQGQMPAPRAGLQDYVPGTNASGFGPQGGLRISVAGLGRIMQLLMNQGSLDGVRLLRPATVAAMLQPQWRAQSNPAQGDTLSGLFQSWALGAQVFVDASGPSSGDRLAARGGIAAVGHLGFAYGLHAGFIFDPVKRNGVVYALGGDGDDPALHRGRYSSFPLWEERVLDALWSVADPAP